MTTATKEKLEAAGLVGTAVLAVLKIKPVETLLDEWVKKWLKRRPERVIVRRFDQQEIDRAQLSAAEELDTICIMLKNLLAADRVSVIAYEKQPDGTHLGTCLAEDRTEKVASVKSQFQQTPVAADLWAEVQRVHDSDTRWLYVPDAQLLNRPVLRRGMLRTQAKSAYYQTLPDEPGDCAALLSVSWHTATALNADKLDHLHALARLLGAMLREHWHLRPDASS